MREIAFDTETTGLDWRGEDRVIELGAVEMINHVASDVTFQIYVNPGRSVSQATIDITGITDEKLIGAPRFEEPDVVDRLLDFIGDSTIVAHNAGFDRGFLNAELERCGRAAIPEDRWVDTAAMARSKFPGAPASLDALCKRFDISLESRAFHGALLDAQLLSQVYLELRGGRARSFDFGDAAAGARTAVRAPARARPKALEPRLTEAEAAAHDAFVKSLGDAAFWRRSS